MFRTTIILTAMLLSTACAEETQWQDYKTTNIERLASEGKSVFVQYTADWCVTCLIQEEEVLHSKEITTLFKDNNVVLIKADWTEYSSLIDKDIINNGQTGIPMYVVYSHKTNFKAKTLPESITQKNIIDNL